MIPLINRLRAPRPNATPGPSAPVDDPRSPLRSWVRILSVEGVVALAIVATVGATRGRPAGDRVAEPPAPTAEPTPREVTLYAEPQPDDFRPEYDRDVANRSVETWDVYWGWVNTYYRGNFLARGWANEARACLDRVTDPAARRELAIALNDLGKLGSREWAKSRTLRKITTDDVKAWGHRLDQSRRDDDGTGSRLLPTLRAIRAEAKAKVAPKGGP